MQLFLLVSKSFLFPAHTTLLNTASEIRVETGASSEALKYDYSIKTRFHIHFSYFHTKEI